MGKFYNTPACVSDAAGYNVDFDAEYMYMDDGLKLKAIRFDYYKCDDADYNWFILAQIECSNTIKVDRYKVCDLYIECPSNSYVQNEINNLYKLKDKLFKLDLSDIIRKLENHDAE